jgi:hypothetical protein
VLVLGVALARRLRLDPQLEVLGSVVIADSVLVVDVLVGEERPTERLLHDEPVL